MKRYNVFGVIRKTCWRSILKAFVWTNIFHTKHLKTMFYVHAHERCMPVLNWSSKLLLGRRCMNQLLTNRKTDGGNRSCYY